MNFLNVFEQRVGSLFGATAQGLTAPFSFKKLAKKAAREMEAETYVINGVDTAPALYTILVSSEDDLSMRPLYAQITKETAQFIEGQAQGKGYSFVGRPVVRFMADPSLRSGKFSVFAENVDAQTLNRLREEEALFLGVGGSRSGGLGGAAGQRAQRPAQPQPQPMSQGLRPIPQPAPAKPSPADSMSAGLDVMPQEAVLDAEQALLARGGVRQIQNVPLAGSRQVGSPQMPPASQAPQYASAPVYQQAPAAPAAVAVPAVAPVAAARRPTGSPDRSRGAGRSRARPGRPGGPRNVSAHRQAVRPHLHRRRPAHHRGPRAHARRRGAARPQRLAQPRRAQPRRPGLAHPRPQFHERHARERRRCRRVPAP